MAIQALEAGKHVCMTKPMDLETAACRRAVEMAEKKGLLLAVDYESRYRPLAHRVHAAFHQGALGRIILADLRMKWYRTQGYYDGGMPRGWRSRMDTERGSLANQAVHFLDLIQWWLGPVDRLVGRRATRGHDIETEDTAVAMMEFASGALASLATTTCSFPNIGTTMEFTGSEGTLTWTDSAVSRLQVARTPAGPRRGGAAYGADFSLDREAVDRSIEEFPSPEDLPADIIADVVRGIGEGRPVQCDGSEGLKSVALFQAIYASSDGDAWVNLPQAEARS
jgi:predicted dehydrogenase